MKRMVTRTVSLNTYTVRTLNVETAEVLDIDYTVGTTYKETDALKQLQREHETDTLKLCAIVNHTQQEILYGMTEQDFIAHAEILPPRKTAE